MEPYSCACPFAFYCSRGNSQCLGCLFNRQTAEVAQIDDLALLRIELGQIAQRIIQRHDVDILGSGPNIYIIERQLITSVSLGGIALTRIVDQNLSHGAGAYGKEMGAVLERYSALLHEPQECLMQQVGTLQGVIRAFLSQVTMCDLAQLKIDRREQHFECPAISATPLRKQLSYGLVNNFKHLNHPLMGLRINSGEVRGTLH